MPGLSKPEGREELAIRLQEFWGIKDVSAQALLSESYRNAFAVSVYLAAASLYGGRRGSSSWTTLHRASMRAISTTSSK